MFDKEYVFKGKHATYVKELTSSFGKESNYKIFSRNLDVLLLAPIIGFLNKKESVIDKSSNDSTKIFLEQMLNIKDDMKYNYRLIMLNDRRYESNYEKRIEKAFKNIGTPEGEKDLEHFNNYILGGVEILHKEIIEKGKNTEDYILNLFNFVNEFDSINNEERDFEDML